MFGVITSAFWVLSFGVLPFSRFRASAGLRGSSLKLGLAFFLRLHRTFGVSGLGFRKKTLGYGPLWVLMFRRQFGLRGFWDKHFLRTS